jgi:glycosyltransferase involved in cell wall biosynthesis
MISVVIPAHNAARTLGDCLQAIRGSDYAACEVIVVDDASTDDTAQLAAQYGCRVVRLPQNVGAAQAKNVGVQTALGEIVLFTDADIVLQSDTLRLVAEDLLDPDVAGVVGLLGKKLRYGNFSSQFKNLWMYYTYMRLAASDEASRGVGLFFTSLAAIRREVFLRMGGFDAHYRGASITEDIEFGQRLLSASLRVRLDARLQVEHLKHYDWRELLRTDLQRSLGLSKTWLRRKLEPEQRSSGHKYYASVPWFFVLGVPLAWLLPLFALLALVLAARRPVWVLVTLLDYLALLLVNAPFLNALREARGWLFGVQCCLFLPLDLWVSGLGVLWAVIDYVAGDRY